MATASSLISRALRLIGGVATGETLSSDEAADALTALNALFDTWTAENILQYDFRQETKALTASDGGYTIGSGGDINTDRPARIDSAVLSYGGQDYPVEIITRDEYDAITTKTTTGVPRYLLYEAAFPLGIITLYPVPDGANTYTLKINTWKPFATVAALQTTVTLPPGFDDAVVYNLAVNLAPEYGAAVAPEVIFRARESKQALRLMAYQPLLLNFSTRTPGMRRQRGNLLSDD